MIQEFYDKLKLKFENNNKVLDNNIFQIAIMEFYNNTIFKNSNDNKIAICNNIDSDKHHHLEFRLKGDIDRIIFSLTEKGIIKKYIKNGTKLLNYKEKDKLNIFREATDEENFEAFVDKLKSITPEDDLFDDIDKILKNMNINIHIKSSLLESVLKDEPYMGHLHINTVKIDFHNFINYNNNICTEDVKENIISQYTNMFEATHTFIDNDKKMLSSDEVINFLKKVDSSYSKILFESKSEREFLKNMFENIYLPDLKDYFQLAYDYKIKQVKFYEDFLHENLEILETISEMKENYPYFFDYNSNNLYEEHLTFDEYSKIYKDKTDYSQSLVNIEDVFKPTNGHFNHNLTSSSDNSFVKYSTESYDVLLVTYSTKSFNNGKSLLEINSMVFNDIEKDIDSDRKHLKDSIKKIFEYAYMKNAAINIKQDILNHYLGSNKSYINECFKDVYNDYKDKVIFINDINENYLLDMVHSTDLKMSQIINNLDYIKRERPISSGHFEEVVLKIRNNNKFKMD